MRVREHEKNTPLYVLCRKWVQNEPDTELMPPKDRAEEVAAKEREAATIKLPPIPHPTEEEEAQAARLPVPEEPLPQSQKERPTIEVRSYCTALIRQAAAGCIMNIRMHVSCMVGVCISHCANCLHVCSLMEIHSQSSLKPNSFMGG